MESPEERNELENSLPGVLSVLWAPIPRFWGEGTDRLLQLEAEQWHWETKFAPYQKWMGFPSQLEGCQDFVWNKLHEKIYIYIYFFAFLG